MPRPAGRDQRVAGVTIAAPLAEAIGRATGAAVVQARRTGGGDINAAYEVRLDDDRHAFVKTRTVAPAGEYAAEAAGLQWLGAPGALSVPEVLGVHDPANGDEATRVLVLEWIESGRLDQAGEEELGRGLARVHCAGAPDFGAPPPGAPAPDGQIAPLRLGAVLLPNDPLTDWPTFYAEHRLRPLVAMALECGSLSSAAARVIESVCERMPALAGPPEPPARLHGDLWSGNVLPGADGRPRVIDPAAYGGHREIDLAMLRLFGSPSRRFFAAYEEVTPLAGGCRERVQLWQLLPLLVHAVLFGGGYGAAAERVARRYL